jgi:MFS family permease
VVAYFIVGYGWRAANFYIAALMIMATVPLLMLVVRGSPEPDDDRTKDGRGSQAHPEITEGRTWSTREILSNRTFWLIVIGFLPLMEMTTALVSNLALWTSDLGIGTQRTAFLMSLLSLMMILGKVTFGHLADRVEVRLLFFGAVGLLCVSLLLMTGTPEYPLLLLIVCMVGIAVGGQLPLAGILMGRNFGALSFGSAMGLFYLCIRPVAFSGAIGGWVRDVFGSYDYFWMGALIIILIFTPVMYWVKPVRQ